MTMPPIPIGVDAEGIPVYKVSPALRAILDAEGRVASAAGPCSGKVGERRRGRVVARMCEGHHSELFAP
jgi:hypothetical protein